MSKRKKTILTISSLILLFGTALVIYGKYYKRDHKDVVTSARAFYFTSQQLKKSSENSIPQYVVSEWSDNEKLSIDLSNSTDAKRYSEMDFQYIVHFDYEGKPASVTDNTGILNGGSHDTDTIQQVLPNLTYDQNGEAKVTVTAKTEEPYKSELAAEYIIKKPQTNQAFTYYITDTPGAAYAELHIKSNELQTLMLSWDPASITPNRTDSFLNGSSLTGTNLKEITFSKVIQKGGSAVIKIFKKDSSQDYSITEAQIASGDKPIVAVKKNP